MWCLLGHSVSLGVWAQIAVTAHHCFTRTSRQWAASWFTLHWFTWLHSVQSFLCHAAVIGGGCTPGLRLICSRKRWRFLTCPRVRKLEGSNAFLNSDSEHTCSYIIYSAHKVILKHWTLGTQTFRFLFLQLLRLEAAGFIFPTNSFEENIISYNRSHRSC